MMRGLVVFVTILGIIFPQISNGFVLQDQEETTPEKSERAVEKEYSCFPWIFNPGSYIVIVITLFKNRRFILKRNAHS